MFERLTDRARRAVVFAQEAARGLGHNYIGTEHLVLGLTRMPEAVGTRALVSLGVRLSDLRPRIEEFVGRGQQQASHGLPFSQHVKKALERAHREAVAGARIHRDRAHPARRAAAGRVGRRGDARGDGRRRRRGPTRGHRAPRPDGDREPRTRPLAETPLE
jgi:hypothetical protein